MGDFYQEIKSKFGGKQGWVINNQTEGWNDEKGTKQVWVKEEKWDRNLFKETRLHYVFQVHLVPPNKNSISEVMG